MTTGSTLSTLVLFTLASFVASTCDISSAICYSTGITCPSSGSSITVNGRTYYLTDIDVVSFNDLTITNGDIQKRVAVRNNFYATNGVSVGDLLTDNCGFGLIVGGDLVWSQDGAVFPTNQTYFVGGRVTGPSYMNNQIVSCGSFGQSSGCIDTYFNDLYTYWTTFSRAINVLADNVQITYLNGVATLTCSGPANSYNVHMASSDFNQIIGYATANCDTSANWIFNLNGDVTFGGNPIQVGGAVIYNIQGNGTVFVTSSVVGSIIAPNANINMVGGTIYGQVIAGNFTNVIQINPPTTCPGRVASRDVYSCTGASTPSSSSASGSSASGSTPVDPSSSASGSASSTTAAEITISGSDANIQPNANNNQQVGGASSLVASLFVSMIAAAFI